MNSLRKGSENKFDMLKELPNIEDTKAVKQYAMYYYERFDKEQKKSGHLYFTFQILILAVSALTPFINSFVPAVLADVKIYTTAFALISAISVGILQLTQAKETEILETQAKIALETEMIQFNSKSGPYSNKLCPTDEIRNDRFIQRIMVIIKSTFNKYYGISQPGGRIQTNSDQH
jgi:hypothetical protein